MGLSGCVNTLSPVFESIFANRFGGTQLRGPPLIARAWNLPNALVIPLPIEPSRPTA